MQNPFQDIKSKKSIAEHISIIREYQQTSSFDREKAIKIYKSFNLEHLEYNCTINAVTKIANNHITIDNAPDDVLIDNLKLQAKWAVGEDYLKSFGIRFNNS